MNIVIAGVGGQGTVLLSRLIGGAAVAKRWRVRGTETIGMAQRGGGVVSHVRIAAQDEPIASPLIPPGKADLLIAFEPGEAVRAYPLLKKGGAAVVLDRAIKPVTSSLKGDDYTGEEMAAFLRANVERLILVDGEALIRALGTAKAVNVALFGVALGAGLLPFDFDDAERAMAERIPERLMEMNHRALLLGKEIAGLT